MPIQFCLALDFLSAITNEIRMTHYMNYKLLSLEEIKKYIDQHKHLPEVPSAKEMETNGVNVSEMNMLLLRKIEEFTLYVIELKKRDEEQRTQIERLISKVEDLKIKNNRHEK